MHVLLRVQKHPGLVIASFMELAFWKFSTRCSLPCTQQYVGWARCPGDLTVPYAREREREKALAKERREREREREIE